MHNCQIFYVSGRVTIRLSKISIPFYLNCSLIELYLYELSFTVGIFKILIIRNNEKKLKLDVIALH